VTKFLLSQQADSDIDAIWDYTVGRWGVEQAIRYHRAIEAACNALARGELPSKAVTKMSEVFRMARCQHHYLIYFAGNPIRIIGVLHEKMDIVTRVTTRVGGG
jgi:toxin ParE1/3/4